MSLLASRVSMIHRLTVERDSNASTPDDWGNPSPPDWDEHLADVPCRAWTALGPRPGTESVDANGVMVVEDRRASVALGTDITEIDRVTEITARGEVFLDGPMNVVAVLRYPDHLELVLRRVR